MSKKIIALSDYISASEAAQILSFKLQRTVDPHYIHRMKNIRQHKVNSTTFLYHKEDIQAATVRQKKKCS